MILELLCIFLIGVACGSLISRDRDTIDRVVGVIGLIALCTYTVISA